MATTPNSRLHANSKDNSENARATTALTQEEWSQLPRGADGRVKVPGGSVDEWNAYLSRQLGRKVRRLPNLYTVADIDDPNIRGEIIERLRCGDYLPPKEQIDQYDALSSVA